MDDLRLNEFHLNSDKVNKNGYGSFCPTVKNIEILSRLVNALNNLGCRLLTWINFNPTMDR